VKEKEEEEKKKEEESSDEDDEEERIVGPHSFSLSSPVFFPLFSPFLSLSLLFF